MIGSIAFASILASVSTLTVIQQQPPTFSVPRGAQHVPMLLLTFRADCSGDRVVEEIALLRKGLGASTDISAVYAEAAGLRVSTAPGIARDGAVQLRLKGFTVPTCSAKDLVLFADFSATSNVAGEHRFEIIEGSDIIAPGAVVRVEAAPGASTSGVRTAGDQAGKVSIDYLKLLKSVRYGDNRVVMRLKFTVQGNIDHEVQRITFTNQGSARDTDLQNIVLKDSRGKQISSAAKQMTGNRVVLTLDPPFALPHGGSRTVELHADIRSGARRTIKFIIEEPGDVLSREVRGRTNSRR